MVSITNTDKRNTVHGWLAFSRVKRRTYKWFIKCTVFIYCKMFGNKNLVGTRYSLRPGQFVLEKLLWRVCSQPPPCQGCGLRLFRPVVPHGSRGHLTSPVAPSCRQGFSQRERGESHVLTPGPRTAERTKEERKGRHPKGLLRWGLKAAEHCISINCQMIASFCQRREHGL